MKKKIETRFCIECGGELEPLDNQDSHTNPKVCIKVLKEKLDDVWDKLIRETKGSKGYSGWGG
jgi:hypothetical protein